MIVPDLRPAAPRRVLVVDDDSVTRLLIVHHLKKRGYEVIAATGVEEAKAAGRRESVATLQAVVTDYLMPDGTGLELIEWLKQEDENIGAIVVTSLSERDLVKQSLRGGACDFLDKPIQIEALLQSVRGAIDHTERGRHLKATETSVREVGRFQQFTLGPGAANLPSPVEICWHPMHPVGGDLVNVIPLGPHRLLVLAADVSGHDLKAGFISAFFQGIVRGLVEKGTPIEEVFTYFNRFLIAEWSRSQGMPTDAHSVAASVSACALVVDSQSRVLKVFNNGFPLPLLTDRGGSKPCGRQPGFPLGWFPESPVEISEHDISAGGCIYLWTDGLEELAARLGVDPRAVAAELFAARRASRVPECLKLANDDILLVRLSLGPDEAGEMVTPIVGQELSASQEKEIDALQETWKKSLRLVLPSLTEDRIFDVLLCAREAVLNAVRYGCRADQPGGKIEISCHGPSSLLRVVVSDEGPGYDFCWKSHLGDAPDDLVDGHRGLALIHQLPTATRMDRRGALVTMDFSLLQP